MTAGARTGSAFAPLRHRTFAVLWAAALVGNIGLWMRDVGAGWLMTQLAPDPVMIALVQAAASLPAFLFSLPAGALADVLDRRRLMLAVQVALMGLSVGLAILTLLNLMTPLLLLLAVLAGGVGTALTNPAWQSIVPELVPKSDLRPAVALNSLGVNIARAVGPALGGLVIVSVGIWAAFAADALSFIPFVAALLWWKRPGSAQGGLPPERVTSAMVAGVRYARSSPMLRATLVRAGVFFLFASAPWALLPLIVRNELAGDAALYGLILAGVGAGAILGALVMPRIRAALSPGRMVTAGTALVALCCVLFAMLRLPAAVIGVALVFGLAWIVVLTSLNVAAQASLPNWVRGRGLAIYLTVFSGAMTVGSLVWGQAAASFGVSSALVAAGLLGLAAGGLATAVPLPSGDLDLSPSGHWPEPASVGDHAGNRGPVMVAIEYRIAPSDAADFAVAIRDLAAERRRDGAYDWILLEDAGDPALRVECFFVASWVEHLRQHERVTVADADAQARVRLYHRGEEPPLVRHLIAV